MRAFVYHDPHFVLKEKKLIPDMKLTYKARIMFDYGPHYKNKYTNIQYT